MRQDGPAAAEALPISALQHFVYCPRQAALIHTEVPSLLVLEFGVACSGRNKVIGSCGEVNSVLGWLLGKGLPALHLAHRDLAGGE